MNHQVTPDVTVSRHTSNIGPKHDPYELVTWVLQHKDGTKVVVQDSALAMGTKVEFFSDYQASPVRVLNWNWIGRHTAGSYAACGELKADLITKQAIGITISAAQEAWNEAMAKMEPDPMGPVGFYI